MVDRMSSTKAPVRNRSNFETLTSRGSIEPALCAVARKFASDYRRAGDSIQSSLRPPPMGGETYTAAESRARVGAALMSAGKVGATLLVECVIRDRPTRMVAEQLGFRPEYGIDRLREALATVSVHYKR